MSLGKPSSGGWSSRHRGWGRCPHAQGSPQCKPAPTAACSPLPSFHCFLPHISAQHRKSLPLPPRIAAALPSLLYSWPRALLSLAAPRWAVPRARPAGPCTAWCRCELRAGTAASGLALSPALQRARSASCPSAGSSVRFPPFHTVMPVRAQAALCLLPFSRHAAEIPWRKGEGLGAAMSAETGRRRKALCRHVWAQGLVCALQLGQASPSLAPKAGTQSAWISSPGNSAAGAEHGPLVCPMCCATEKRGGAGMSRLPDNSVYPFDSVTLKDMWRLQIIWSSFSWQTEGRSISLKRATVIMTANKSVRIIIA